MGTGQPGPWGTDTHLSSWPSPSHAHPPSEGSACGLRLCPETAGPQAAERSQERSPRVSPTEGAGREEAGRGGVWVTHL